MLVWSLRGASDLSVHAWEGEDEVVAFSAITGDTHLLDEFGLAIIQSLSVGPRTTLELSDHLSKLVDGDGLGDLPALIEATLDRLQRSGLVVSSPLENI